MKPGLEPPRSAEIEIVVTPEMCPHFDGALVHPVYATWTLVHDMEVVGRKLLAPHLEPHEEGLGVHISVDHKHPAPIGSTVVVRAEVEHATHRQLTCRMTAYCKGRLLATGRFVQAVLPRARIQAMFEHIARPSGDSPPSA